jgi:hypothetical protein
VARPVGSIERKGNAKAIAALEKEWTRLRKIGCWDEKGVRPWAEVSAEARAADRKQHVGRIFEIRVEENSELSIDDPSRKYKGRVVFQGNQVKDENWEAAMFQELSSCPATVEAGKAADCFGMMPGHDLQQGDAVQSYTQSRLGGVETWIRLPEDQQPLSWKGIRDPVCPLVLALYGHPDAGGFWEMHCEAHLVKIGFVPIDDWRSCFFHPKWNMFLVVYVDDFKLAGPAKHMAEAWVAIRQGIVMEDPAPAGLYLGCKHELSDRVLPCRTTPVRTIEYNMEEFLRSCVERYQRLSGIAHMRLVPTPFLGDVSTGPAGTDPDKLPPHRVEYTRKGKQGSTGSAGATGKPKGRSGRVGSYVGPGP